MFFVVHDWNHTAAFASLMPVFGWAMTKIGPKRLYAINFIGWLGTAWLFAAWMLVGTLPEPWAVFPYIADIDQIISFAGTVPPRSPAFRHRSVSWARE